MSYFKDDELSLSESLREHPWQGYEYVSVQGGKVHQHGDGNRALCGLTLTQGFNWYESMADFHPRAFCSRCKAKTWRAAVGALPR